MSTSKDEEKVLLPHHEQQELCTTRLPYRQGRKLTAVKTYTITDESNHLLIFNVPSLKLRQETKSLFLKFGRIIQFSISTDHPADPFTDTYHCVYERIQSARIAKKMLDTKNFYGESLHVCYAPELESIAETRQKLLQRRIDVTNRLRNLSKESTEKKIQEETVNESDNNTIPNDNVKKLNMGDLNTISIGKQMRDVEFKSKKRKGDSTQISFKKFKPCYLDNNIDTKNSNDNSYNNTFDDKKLDTKETKTHFESKSILYNNPSTSNDSTNDIAIIDCTSTESEVITNLNESLNYNKFGNEVVKRVEAKPLNRIKFNFKDK